MSQKTNFTSYPWLWVFIGLFITSSLGRRWMKTLLTQGDIRCVWGDRKWMLRTTTVTHILKVMHNDFGYWILVTEDRRRNLYGWKSIYWIEDTQDKYLNVSRIIVKSTNFPRRGTTRDVGGIISASSKKNTVNERRMEIARDTFSPLSEGR